MAFAVGTGSRWSATVAELIPAGNIGQCAPATAATVASVGMCNLEDADGIGTDTLLMQSVTTQDGSVRVSGMSQSTLLAAIKGLRGSFAPESGAAGIARGFDGRASHSLYQEIIAPVIDPLIKGGVKIDHLILIPDGIMEGLPYNALLTEWDDSASNPARWKWLSTASGCPLCRR